MAIIYSREQGGTRYEIRTAGNSVRLYANGVLHTQYNPRHQATGGVWDLLALPAAVLPRVERVLLLGVGGGAAVQLLRHWFPGVEITGVDLNGFHLSLARRFFGIGPRQATLIEADARVFVKDYRGERFDLVIEDLFGDGEGEPQRAIDADRSWCRALQRLVAPRGALAINTLSRRQLHQCAFVQDPVLRRAWPGQLYMTLPAYENVVGAFFRNPLDPAHLHAAVRGHALLANLEKAGKLRYRIHRTKTPV